ncbi:hypothetical protein ACE01N_05800 [Saccharicrinis sp. FJH2]|uniref:hypothetical protein n=1 Tax=Saccharicrinis sp. FJH65 TaxID=3344659 RepID=UPI0035F33C34
MKGTILNKGLLLFVIFFIANTISLFAYISDPAFESIPEENDSASVSVSETETLENEKESFYLKAEKANSSQQKFKVKSDNSDFWGLIEEGEITAANKEYKPDKHQKVPMWGEADLSFELEEMIRNYRELLKTYQSHSNWAQRVNNQQIVDLMNVKITQTKKLIKECKRNLRKY